MLNMYEFTIPPLKRALANLAQNLSKSETYAKAKNIEASVLLNARLFADMYPLIRQIQIATDMSKGAGARLAGVEVPKYEDRETTFEALQARITKTIAFLESLRPEQFVDAEIRPIVITVRDTNLHFVGQDYLLKWVFPNVYFHCTTAYNILRHNGVELGKLDFLGPRD
jgi:hypothetical protein